MMIGRQAISLLKRNASTALKRTKPKIDAAPPLTTTSAVAATGKMPLQRPVLTPLQKRQSPFEVQELPFFNESPASAPTSFPSQLLLPASQLQGKLSKDLKVAADLFGANYLVWRGELMSKLAAFYRENSTFLLAGQRGVGKSAVLMQMFVALQQAGGDDLLLLIPDTAKWTTGYFAYYPTAGGDFEQPELALEILQLLLWSNSGKHNLPVRPEEIKEASKDPLSLAMPLYSRVMAEIKTSGRKLTILADEVNGLIQEESLTGYTDVNGSALPLRSFPLCRDFIKGADRFIGALTRCNPLLPKLIASSSSSSSSFPEFIVTAYSDSEIANVLKMYRKLGHLSVGNPVDEQFVAMKAFLSGRNGRLLFKSCEYDSIYN